MKIDPNEQILLRKKLISPDLIKSNNANCSKLNSSNNTNNILKKLGFSSPKLNSYLKIINESVKKNSIKTVFAEYVKKQKTSETKTLQQKVLNTSNPSKCHPLSVVPTKISTTSSNNRNNASLKCGLSKNLTDQSNKLFIDLTSTEMKYNGPKQDERKQLKEDLMAYDNIKNNSKRAVNLSPKNITLKDSQIKTANMDQKKDKVKLFDHSNSSKPIAFKNLQKSVKNKI